MATKLDETTTPAIRATSGEEEGDVHAWSIAGKNLAHTERPSISVQ